MISDDTLPSAHDVVAFWRDAGPERWFAKSDAFDAACIDRLAAAHQAAASGRLDVHFGLPDGSVVVHPASDVALAAELSKRCTERLPNGWYRRHRCSSQ